jgi:hypothetical protein
MATASAAGDPMALRNCRNVISVLLLVSWLDLSFAQDGDLSIKPSVSLAERGRQENPGFDVILLSLSESP